MPDDFGPMDLTPFGAIGRAVEYFTAPDGSLTDDPAQAAPAEPQYAGGEIMSSELPPAQMTSEMQEGGVIGPVGAQAPWTAEAQFTGAPQSPLEAEAAERMHKRDLGLEWKGGSAPVEEAWIPGQRTGAIPDKYAPERADLLGRGKGLALDERDIQYDENERARRFAREREIEAQTEVLKQEHKLASINADVSTQKAELDRAMEDHRKLISKGISPWAAYGAGSAAEGRMVAALTMATASAAGPEYAKQSAAMIDSIINREVNAQMYEIETAGGMAQNAYSKLRDKYGDEDQAEAALRALMGDAAKAQLNSMQLETADPRSALQAQQTIQSLEEAALRENDKFYERSLGKMTEKYQQERAGSAGHWGWAKGSVHDKHLGSRATTAGREATTTEKWAELTGPGEAGAAENAMKAIPIATRDKITNSDRLVDDLEELVKVSGGRGIDRKTGEILGYEDMKDIKGVGPADEFQAWTSMPLVHSDEQARAKALRDRIVYGLNRDEGGANLTAMELKNTKGFRQANFDTTMRPILQDLVRDITGRRNARLKSLPSDQRRAMEGAISTGTEDIPVFER